MYLFISRVKNNKQKNVIKKKLLLNLPRQACESFRKLIHATAQQITEECEFSSWSKQHPRNLLRYELGKRGLKPCISTDDAPVVIWGSYAALHDLCQPLPYCLHCKAPSRVCICLVCLNSELIEMGFHS